MNENLPKPPINWDKFAEALKDKFAQEMVDEKDGQEDPYNWFLEDVTVSDIVDFVKDGYASRDEVFSSPKLDATVTKNIEICLMF